MKPGIHELFTILLRLERRERFVRERLDLLQERAGAFPNEVSLRQQAFGALRERLNVT